jgi:hypothetical protein
MVPKRLPRYKGSPNTQKQKKNDYQREYRRKIQEKEEKQHLDAQRDAAREFRADLDNQDILFDFLKDHVVSTGRYVEIATISSEGTDPFALPDVLISGTTEVRCTHACPPSTNTLALPDHVLPPGCSG